MTTLNLTPKQRDIVIRRCDLGQPNKQIAYEVGRTTATIKTHWTRLYKQTGLTAYQICTLWGDERRQREDDAA